MLFIIKKWIGGLLMPFPFALCILFISLLLLFFTQKQKLAKTLALFSFIMLLTFSVLPTAYYLSKPLERQYPPLLVAEQSLDYILVLGSSGVHDQTLPITGQLSATALSRFSEALRLYYANPNATLVLSGSGFGDSKSHAQLLQTLATSFSIPEKRIIRLDETKDTHQEAQQMSALINGKKAALVTSATHMPRAMQLFQHYNTFPIPAPTLYLAKTNQHELPAYYYIPSAYQAYKVEVAFHEYLGELQRWLIGK